MISDFDHCSESILSIKFFSKRDFDLTEPVFDEQSKRYGDNSQPDFS